MSSKFILRLTGHTLKSSFTPGVLAIKRCEFTPRIFFFFCGLIGSRRDNLKAATTLGVLDKDKRFDIRLIDQSRLIQKYLAPRPRGIKENEWFINPWSSMRFLLVCFYYNVEAKYDFFVTWNEPITIRFNILQICPSLRRLLLFYLYLPFHFLRSYFHLSLSFGGSSQIS